VLRNIPSGAWLFSRLRATRTEVRRMGEVPSAVQGASFWLSVRGCFPLVCGRVSRATGMIW
jgi:hypothetical protein